MFLVILEINSVAFLNIIIQLVYFVMEWQCVCCEVGTECLCLYIFQDKFCLQGLLSLRRLVVDLSPRRPMFDPAPVYVKFVMDRIAVGRFSLSSVPYLYSFL